MFKLPKIGDGVTISVGSDSYPGTIIAVTSKTIMVREDAAVCISGCYATEIQDWQITPDPNGRVFRAQWSEKRQCYRDHGTPVYVGHRRRYNDPCF
jgi:hypothetical protein